MKSKMLIIFLLVVLTLSCQNTHEKLLDDNDTNQVNVEDTTKYQSTKQSTLVPNVALVMANLYLPSNLVVRNDTKGRFHLAFMSSRGGNDFPLEVYYTSLHSDEWLDVKGNPVYDASGGYIFTKMEDSIDITLCDLEIGDECNPYLLLGINSNESNIHVFLCMVAMNGGWYSIDGELIDSMDILLEKTINTGSNKGELILDNQNKPIVIWSSCSSLNYLTVRNKLWVDMHGIAYSSDKCNSIVREFSEKIKSFAVDLGSKGNLLVFCVYTVEDLSLQHFEIARLEDGLYKEFSHFDAIVSEKTSNPILKGIQSNTYDGSISILWTMNSQIYFSRWFEDKGFENIHGNTEDGAYDIKPFNIDIKGSSLIDKRGFPYVVKFDDRTIHMHYWNGKKLTSLKKDVVLPADYIEMDIKPLDLTFTMQEKSPFIVYSKPEMSTSTIFFIDMSVEGRR